MMTPATRNRLIIAAAFVIAAVVIGYQMFFSLTPPRHADHDHAMATLDAGGFLWIEALEGQRRNLVGRPGKVLVLHFFDPAAGGAEQRAAARFAEETAADPAVEMIFVAQTSSEQGLREWSEEVDVPRERLYLDPGGRTAELIGVRRLPETLVYDPKGLLAYQARGPVDWGSRSIVARIEAAKAGVEEIA